MYKGHVIKEVYKGSITEEMGVEAGDTLLTINGREIDDVFDYRYLVKDDALEVLIRKSDGEEWLLDIAKDCDEDLGLRFGSGLMGEYRSCRNKCIFCFIDQMPSGMRETLYFKDDDARLSFLQGNYVTLTNMARSDIDRIIRYRLSPINISVHTTNPGLRCMMLSNRHAGECLGFMKDLYDANIEMNAQIVLCKNVNDNGELRRTIDDLSAYLPILRSVSVVPAGITRYREGLYPLGVFSKEDAQEIIDVIEDKQRKFYDEYGLHFIHASDEWYVRAERDFPEEDRYDGYVQLENGVGMMRLFLKEFEDGMEEFEDGMEEFEDGMKELIVTIITGQMAYPVMVRCASRLMEHFTNIRINVFAIRNDFFGETVTVSGLVTGRDLICQLRERKAAGEMLGDRLLIPGNMLRMGEDALTREAVFLDDVTVSDVEDELGVKVVVTGTGGRELIMAVGKL